MYGEIRSPNCTFFIPLGSRSCYRLRLATVGAHSAGHVRRIVRTHLIMWGMRPLADPAELGVTELLSNVVKHVPRPSCTVVLWRRDDGVRVEVRDPDPRMPRPRAAGEADEGGRGLALLSAFTHAWDAERAEDGGKTVWFELKGAPEPPPRP